VLPFLLMVLTLVVVLLLTGSEVKAGLLSLGVLVPYYLSVWMLRDRIGQQVSFYLED
jgi:sigma-E factor negative regulatory protein RseC